jgi:hypothetical protein
MDMMDTIIQFFCEIGVLFGGIVMMLAVFDNLSR